MAENQRIIAGRYEVGSLIGRGGMADVYEGVDTRLGRVVAIKVLKSDLANDPNFEDRFRQEAQASARMAHPTIVRVYDAGEEQDVDTNGNQVRRPYIVMEYVRGTLLRDLLHHRRLSIQESIDYAQGVLTALEISHRSGVIHRDIKAANIMITDSGQVKVMDFGIARAIAEGSATVSHTSGIVGTAQYFSPEQARGETVDSRTDLYSAGVLLYEMLAGRPPFKGETAVSVAYQHVSEAVTPPSEHNPALSAELDAVVLRALAKDRNARFQTAEEFRENLMAAANTVPDAPVITGAVETVSAAEVAAPVEAEANPLDEFEALLREASEEATNAVSVAGGSDQPATTEVPVVESKSDFDRIADGEDSVSTPAENPFAELGVSFDRTTAMSQVDENSGQTELIDSDEKPAAAKFRGFAKKAARKVSGQGEYRAPNPNGIFGNKGLMWGIGSGLTVVLVGLLVFFFASGGIKWNPGTPIVTTIDVADVSNQSYDTAYNTLIDQRLLVTKAYEPSDTIPADVVIRTNPPAGTKVGENTLITVYVSTGKKMVQMPDLTGKTEEEAAAALLVAKLTLGTITPSNSSTVPAGQIISSEIAPNTLIAEGSVVNLISSNGKVQVPDVVNLNISDAKNKLTAVDVGFTVTVATQNVCAGTLGTTVLSQSIPAGLADQGQAIVLYVECVG